MIDIRTETYAAEIVWDIFNELRYQTIGDGLYYTSESCDVEIMYKGQKYKIKVIPMFEEDK